MGKYNFDCIDFRGYKPCVAKKTCDECTQYRPWKQKIVVVKLGALGDVMRTTPILYALERKYPQAHITWVTKLNAKEMLETTPRIHRLVFVDQPDQGGILRMLVEEFDELYCYDKEDAAIGLASLIKSKKKFGMFMNAQGQMAPINKASEYSFDLGLSDELKFKINTKTYQETIYDCSEIAVAEKMDPYDFHLKEADLHVAQKAIAPFIKAKGPIVGLNTGSGKVFKTKQWIEDYFYELAVRLVEEKNAQILLLGGKDEDEKNIRLAEKLKNRAFYPGCSFTIRQFAAILKQCNVVVTSDTLAMHLALAVETPPIVLFGSTCAQEIEMYGMGEKLVSQPECAPCYLNECNQKEWMKCMYAISPDQVYRSIEKVLA